MEMTEKNREHLEFWRERFENAYSDFSAEALDERELLYLGVRDLTQSFDGIRGQFSDGVSKNVRNIAYEFVEAQVNTDIPQPVVSAKNAADEQNARVIEASLKSDLSNINFQALNDQQERTCPVAGHSFFEVFWNQDKRGGSWSGEIDVRLIHPKQFVPQPGAYNLKDMNYFFILSSVSREYIKNRYGVELADPSEEYPGVNTLTGDSVSPVTADERTTEFVCWYKDEEGDVCRFVWTDDVILEDTPKFYCRRFNFCSRCDSLLRFGEEKCACGSDATYVSCGDRYIAPKDIETPGGKIKKGSEIPFYIPKCWPVVMRVNVPLAFQFGGQSDVEIIKDQYDAIKKVGTKVLEKIVRAGSYITIPKDLANRMKPSNLQYQVVPVDNPMQKSLIDVFTLEADIQNDLRFIDMQYVSARDLLGITESYLGRKDSSAPSGFAKEILVKQAKGRLESKNINKHEAYKELFEVMFCFKLAFFDEPRSFISRDENGNIKYAEFSKFRFLKSYKDDFCRDVFYYDVDYAFDTNRPGAGDFPAGSLARFEQVCDLFRAGAFGDTGEPATLALFWDVLATLKFPMSDQIREIIHSRAETKEILKGGDTA